MYKTQECLAIIPARIGSKGIPKKNIIPIMGKPMISYTIETTLSSTFVSRCIVSTDDSDIEKISIREGSDVIIRSSKIAQDNSSIQEVVSHVLENISETYQYLIVLQPTSPLRTSIHIDECSSKMKLQKKESAVSVCSPGHHPYKSIVFSNEKVSPIRDWKDMSSPRQELPICYQQNGAIYIVSTELYRKHKRFLFEDSMLYEMSPEESIDVDDKYDLMQVTAILENQERDIK